MQDDFDSFDIPPTQTATSYLVHLADNAVTGKFERLLANDAHQRSEALGMTMLDRLTDLFTLLIMRGSIADIVVGKYNDSPFYITHPDLHNRNIIIEGTPVVEILSSSATSPSSTKSGYPREAHSATDTTSVQDQKLNLAGVID